ncbi:glycoside hydrolase family 88 protein [Olivibacter sp. SDN3]|uniref:glycoside hydrolase family 88 protein n=1 Tax=Olivibacter sp. SDN3 TaxID=2764720 RepID=UPI001C9E80F1|nr:glycoside hydrolase family 88 protein [Olivibacter sp. SDN3]
MRYTSANLTFAYRQTQHMLDSLTHLQKDRLPKSVDEQGNMTQSDIYDWTSGFFPGTLWYIYEFSEDTAMKNQAIHWTRLLEPVKDFYGHHDVGFMINCSYGNAYRITQDTVYKQVMVKAARSLTKRYDEKVGAILSWNVDDGSWQSERGWKYPVIIDNMMNLELLFNAFNFTGDSTFYKIAVAHADKTLANHFRSDYSSYHVVDYDPETGVVSHQHTAQGFAHESAWSRGQAWGLYGFAFCYRETGFDRYLEQAEHIADYILNHPRLPEDKIPYWDFDAPDIPSTYRDASAAAIIASGLLDLAEVMDGEKAQHYRIVAREIIHNLSAPPYRAALGTNQGYILKHSVGSIPHGNEIDVPLIYADYYYVESLMKLRRLQ